MDDQRTGRSGRMGNLPPPERFVVPVASFWTHNTAKDRQSTQDNERHPRRPDGMCPGSGEA
jgi:hypothetical protein